MTTTTRGGLAQHTTAFSTIQHPKQFGRQLAVQHPSQQRNPTQPKIGSARAFTRAIRACGRFSCVPRLSGTFPPVKNTRCWVGRMRTLVRAQALPGVLCARSRRSGRQARFVHMILVSHRHTHAYGAGWESFLAASRLMICEKKFELLLGVGSVSFQDDYWVEAGE